MGPSWGFKEIWTPASRKASQRGKRGQRKNRQGQRGRITQMVQPLNNVPRPSNAVHKIRRSWTLPISYFGTAGWANLGSPDFQINFAASVSNVNIGGVSVYGPNTPNASELSALFDQYRLVGATIRIDWDYNSYPVSAGQSIAPVIYYVADYDDSGGAILTDLLQYPGVQTHSFMENGYSPLICHVKPKPLRDIASTGLLTAYGPMSTAPWIRTADMTTPHYGLKFCASQFGVGGTAQTGSISITCYLDMEFANPK